MLSIPILETLTYTAPAKYSTNAKAVIQGLTEQPQVQIRGRLMRLVTVLVASKLSSLSSAPGCLWRPEKTRRNRAVSVDPGVLGEHR